MQPFVFVGNVLWLDFVNTVVQDKGQSVDFLKVKSDWVDWLKFAGIHSDGGVTSFQEVLKFRDILQKVALELSNGKRVNAGAIEKINSYLTGASSLLVRRERGWALENQFPNPLSEIAQSVALSLTSSHAELIRKCEASDCVLYFCDTSKSHKRRWCSMKTCGNRAKVSAFFARGAVL
jgi:predicted RNA-binding Zn ribbon-like protein